VQEVAEMLGMSKGGVYRLIREGRLHAIKISPSAQSDMPAPRRMRVPKAALDEFLRGDANPDTNTQTS